MRTLGLSAVLLGACMTTNPDPSPSGGDGSDGNPSGGLSCAPDPTISEGAIELDTTDLYRAGPIANATLSVWTGESLQVTSGWSDVCSGLTACPIGVGTSNDTPVYARCAHQAFTTTVTTTGAANTVADGTITTAAAGTIAVHVASTNEDNHQTIAGDATVVVHDLEAIRIRCFVDPFGTPTPCPDKVPAGTQIGFAVDGLADDGHYDGVLGDVSWQGTDPVYVDETAIQLPGEGYVALWYPAYGLDHTTTITVDEVGVTASLTVTME